MHREARYRWPEGRPSHWSCPDAELLGHLYRAPSRTNQARRGQPTRRTEQARSVPHCLAQNEQIVPEPNSGDLRTLRLELTPGLAIAPSKWCLKE